MKWVAWCVTIHPLSNRLKPPDTRTVKSSEVTVSTVYSGCMPQVAHPWQTCRSSRNRRTRGSLCESSSMKPRCGSRATVPHSRATLFTQRQSILCRLCMLLLYGVCVLWFYTHYHVAAPPPPKKAPVVTGCLKVWASLLLLHMLLCFLPFFSFYDNYVGGVCGCVSAVYSSVSTCRPTLHLKKQTHPLRGLTSVSTHHRCDCQTFLFSSPLFCSFHWP